MILDLLQMAFILRCVLCMVTSVFIARNICLVSKVFLWPSCWWRTTWPPSCGSDRRVDSFIQSDRHVSISDIVLHSSISRRSVQRIIHNHLKFCKVSARWMPKQLQSEQLAMQMMTSLNNLLRRRGSNVGENCNRRRDVGAPLGYQPESKRASMQWKQAQRIANSDQVQSCAFSKQNGSYGFLGHERNTARWVSGTVRGGSVAYW